MAETPEEILVEVIDIHRVRPNRGVCSCGWEAEGAETPSLNPRAALAPRTRRTPAAQHFFRHLAAEQCKALRSAGFLRPLAVDEDQSSGERDG
ncbi:hypothetical protein ABFU82_22450 [Nocardioides sp. WV_118_6]